ncbi:hypothetical protein L227DRAFT_193909 [Lentinus tigrinus ALCF2SS1-6]|uniref:Uncharacterized protein n=1 Tax=Lentinus tigrinus ALCF2SS1-6 TaxID=1328759 RepID=A0A5C2S464_9APHY|nr:hypothetical protein L227DRAFT_193909 [Lentinus tigrinus ALCF2SS1-6]
MGRNVFCLLFGTERWTVEGNGGIWINLAISGGSVTAADMTVYCLRRKADSLTSRATQAGRRLTGAEGEVCEEDRRC